MTKQYLFTLSICLLISSLTCTALRAAEALKITAVEFPQKLSPGQKARIKINTNENDPLALKFSCAGREQGSYISAIIEDSKWKKANSEAISGYLCNNITFKVPKTQEKYQNLLFWVRAQSKWITMKAFKNGEQIIERGFAMNPSEKELTWSRVNFAVGNGETFDKFTLSSAEGKGIDCVIISPDPSFNPKLFQDSMSLENNCFNIETPALLTGSQKLKVTASRGEENVTAEILINIESASAKQTKAAEFFPELKNWLPLGDAAKLNPDSEDIRILDSATVNEGKIAIGKSVFEFKNKTPSFAGVWKAVDKAKLKERNAEVAQADDKVRTEQKLPESVEIPVGRKSGALAFLHAEKGAGESGQILWSYEIIFEDGSKESINICEGKQVSGLLKSDETEEASMVWNKLVDGAPSKVYLWIWRNPDPSKSVKAVRMSAVKEKIVPILLGMAEIDPSALPTQIKTESTAKASLEINCLNTVKPVKRGLFSMNNPYMTDKPKAEEGNVHSSRSARLVLGEDSWELYRSMDFVYDRLWVGAWFPKSPDGKIERDDAFKFAEIAMKRIGKDTKTKVILNINPAKWAYEPGSDLDARLAKAASLSVELLSYCLKAGCPVEYVEIFNETLIRHPEDEVKRKYKCFNAIAEAIKKAYPGMKITGTAECWPAVGVIEQFMIACGKNVDAVSWHFYPTGETASSTDIILRDTSKIAKSSVDMDKMLKRVIPERRVPQLITEHNINYAAWKNGGENRQKNGIGALWLFSVMRHLLYDGEADVANYWHYDFGSAYSVANDPGAQPNPSGEGFILLNKYFRGNLLQAASNDRDIEVIAADNGDSVAIAILNLAPQEKELAIKTFNLPFSLNPALNIEKYSVAGEEKRFTREIPYAIDFAGGCFTLKMQAYSTTVYIFPKQAKK